MRPLALAGLILLTVSRASAQAWVGTSSGTLETAALGEDRWTPLTKFPAVLKDGAHVRTGEGATATVVFADHARLRLGPGTELALDEAGARASEAKLQSGSLEAFVPSSPRPRFRLRTPTASLSAQGAEFSAEVSALRDTQIVVADGAVQVVLQNGEKTALGAGQDFRSLLVMSGRPLRLLPHPREEGAAAGKRAAAKPEEKAAREWPDCLHGKNGALRPEIEQVAACQRRARTKLSSAGDLTLDDSADLRHHQQEELREYARAKGWMPAALDGEPERAETEQTAQAAGSGAAGTDADFAQALSQLRATPQTADGADLQLPPQAQDLIKQLQNGGGRVTPGAMNYLFQALLGGQAIGPNTAKSMGRPAPGAEKPAEDQSPP